MGKVPNTISDKKMADLKRRASKQPSLTKKAADQRKASERQRRNADKN